MDPVVTRPTVVVEPPRREGPEQDVDQAETIYVDLYTGQPVAPAEEDD